LPAGEAGEGSVFPVSDEVDIEDPGPDKLGPEGVDDDVGLVREGLAVDAEGEPAEAALPVGLSPEGEEEEPGVGRALTEALVEEDLGI